MVAKGALLLATAGILREAGAVNRAATSLQPTSNLKWCHAEDFQRRPRRLTEPKRGQRGQIQAEPQDLCGAFQIPYGPLTAHQAWEGLKPGGLLEHAGIELDSS